MFNEHHRFPGYAKPRRSHVVGGIPKGSKVSFNLGGYNGAFGILVLVLVVLAIIYFLRRA